MEKQDTPLTFTNVKRTYTNFWCKVLFVWVSLFLMFVFFRAPEAEAQEPASKVLFFVSPRGGTVLEGSEFDVSVYLDTRGANVNTVELNLKFSKDKLVIVKPSGEKAFIMVWNAPPSYSNTEGTVHFSGTVPRGLTTEAGLISTITFQAIATGPATVEVLASSRVLAHDGAGTPLPTEFGKGIFNITPRPPEGVRVFSETHQFESRWYNNSNPVLLWEKAAEVQDFSFILDREPSTTPDNTPETDGTIFAYEDLADGVWYFHIKARRRGVWGPPTHFTLRTDNTPPLPFEPQVELVYALLTQGVAKALIFFTTSDALSGIDHFEVGVIDRAAPLESAAFVRAESPYQLSAVPSSGARVVVRAIDRAGKVRDQGIDIDPAVPPSPPALRLVLVKRYLLALYVATVLVLFLLFLLHHLFGYGIFGLFKRLLTILKKDREREKRHHEEHREK